MYVKKNMTLLRYPIEKGLDMLGGKWKSRILCVLAQRGPIRYGQFKQEMTNVTDTALSGALKELIRDGLVDRKQYNEVPLRVEYELTPYGLAAVRLLRQIADWKEHSIMEHPTNLIIRDCTSQGSELCHELADALFQHQAAMAKDPLHKDILGNMRYETRLKRSFDNTEEKLLLVAFDGEKPVGYLFAAAEEVTEESRRQLPPWSERIPGGGTGFYPDWLETPVRVGALNNLYILPEYRGTGLGDALTTKGMEWLRAPPGARYLFVDVSEGNNAADFYARYGFKFSHDVLGGIIKAYYQEI